MPIFSTQPITQDEKIEITHRIFTRWIKNKPNCKCGQPIFSNCTCGSFKLLPKIDVDDDASLFDKVYKHKTFSVGFTFPIHTRNEDIILENFNTQTQRINDSLVLTQRADVFQHFTKIPPLSTTPEELRFCLDCGKIAQLLSWITQQLGDSKERGFVFLPCALSDLCSPLPSRLAIYHYDSTPKCLPLTIAQYVVLSRDNRYFFYPKLKKRHLSLFDVILQCDYIFDEAQRIKDSVLRGLFPSLPKSVNSLGGLLSHMHLTHQMQTWCQASLTSQEMKELMAMRDTKSTSKFGFDQLPLSREVLLFCAQHALPLPFKFLLLFPKVEVQTSSVYFGKGAIGTSFLPRQKLYMHFPNNSHDLQMQFDFSMGSILSAHANIHNLPFAKIHEINMGVHIACMPIPLHWVEGGDVYLHRDFPTSNCLPALSKIRFQPYAF